MGRAGLAGSRCGPERRREGQGRRRRIGSGGGYGRHALVAAPADAGHASFLDGPVGSPTPRRNGRPSGPRSVRRSLEQSCHRPRYEAPEWGHCGRERHVERKQQARDHQYGEDEARTGSRQKGRQKMVKGAPYGPAVLARHKRGQAQQRSVGQGATQERKFPVPLGAGGSFQVVAEQNEDHRQEPPGAAEPRRDHVPFPVRELPALNGQPDQQ